MLKIETIPCKTPYNYSREIIETMKKLKPGESFLVKTISAGNLATLASVGGKFLDRVFSTAKEGQHIRVIRRS